LQAVIQAVIQAPPHCPVQALGFGQAAAVATGSRVSAAWPMEENSVTGAGLPAAVDGCMNEATTTLTCADRMGRRRLLAFGWPCYVG